MGKEPHFWIGYRITRIDNDSRLQIWWLPNGDPCEEWCVIFDKDPKKKPVCSKLKFKDGNKWTFDGYSKVMEKRAKRFALRIMLSYDSWGDILNSLR